NPRHLQWLEEAEARNILTMALSEAPQPRSSAPATATTSLWTEFLRRWIASGVALPASRRTREAAARSTGMQQVGERRHTGQPMDYRVAELRRPGMRPAELAVGGAGGGEISRAVRHVDQVLRVQRSGQPRHAGARDGNALDLVGGDITVACRVGRRFRKRVVG